MADIEQEVRRPSAKELHTALYAVHYAMFVINAHVEHRQIDARRVKQFYAAVEELSEYTQYEDPTTRAEELECDFAEEMGLT